jgi:hypothetical protein
LVGLVNGAAVMAPFWSGNGKWEVGYVITMILAVLVALVTTLRIMVSVLMFAKKGTTIEEQLPEIKIKIADM